MTATLLMPDDLPLSERHYEMLHAGSGLSDAIIRERGYRSVVSKVEFRELGFSEAQQRPPGLLIPIRNVLGKPTGYEYRPDNPRTLQGTVVKYEWPAKKPRRFDVPIRCQETLKDPAIPLAFTEGAKKVDALADHGVCGVNLGGVWGFRSRNEYGGLAVSADLENIPLNDRVVYLIFDSDVAVKSAVKKALRALTRQLAMRGAVVRVVTIPAVGAEKLGIDDYLVRHGPVGLARLVDDAVDADTADPLTPVIFALKHAPVAPEAFVPRGYTLDAVGVHTLGEDAEGNETNPTILPSPLVITARHRDIDADAENVTLKFFRDGVWRSLTVGRENIADARSIVKLSGQGLPTTSNSARALVGYVADYEAINIDNIPLNLTTGTCGWKRVGEQDVFMLGSLPIGNAEDVARIDFLAEDHGYERHVAPLHEMGSFEKWRDGVAPLFSIPRIAIGLYASVTAPLLDILDVQSFCLDYVGNTSIGKTTTEEICASVWGMGTKERNGLVKAWDGTKVFTERYAALFNGLPIFFDESQIADQRQLAKIVYALVNGEGRGRGSISGLRRSYAWRTVVFSTGEHPVVESTQDQGIRARVLTFWGPPFGDGHKGELVHTVAATVRGNYGFAGPLVLRYLLDGRNDWAELRAIYEQTRATLSAKHPGNIADRYASYFAAMTVAAMIAHEAWGIPGDPIAAIDACMRDALATVQEGSYGERALALVVGWAAANRTAFYGSHTDDRPPHAFYGAWRGPADDLSIYDHLLADFLRANGFSAQAVMRTWKDLGWLRTNGGAGSEGLKYPRVVNGVRTRMPTIMKEAIATLDPEGEG